MTGLTEANLRAAASWQAFKEGKALFERGAVVEVKAGTGSWRGAVSGGKRPVRVGVTMNSPTDIEARCPCPANRRTGELCAHAVATGLAVLAGGVAAAPAPEKKPEAVAEPVAVAWRVRLPPNWRESVARGSLTATLMERPGEDPDAADGRLGDWLARERVARKPSLHLHLDGHQASGFLAALAGHPVVVAGKDEAEVEVAAGWRVRLAEAERVDATVLLAPEADAGRWHRLGDSFWSVGDGVIARAGSTAVPADLAGALETLAGGGEAEVPVESLLAGLEQWQDWLAFPDGGWLDGLHFVPAPQRVTLELDGSLRRIVAKLRLAYGKAPAVVPGLGVVAGLPRLDGDRCEVRDFAAEARAVDRLERAGFQVADRGDGTWALRGEDEVVGFLARTLPTLRDEWQVRESASFDRASREVAVVEPEIEILGSGEDWLSFDLKFRSSDGRHIPVEDVRRLLRSGKAGSGRRLVVSDELSSVIEPMFSELDLRQEGGHFEASARAGEVVREIRKNLHQAQNKSEESEEIEFQNPVGFEAELRPYQQQGAAWLLERVSRFGGALLADDMGLGKTIQTIAVSECLFSDSDLDDGGVILVVATASLLGNWAAEFGRFAPGRRVRILHGSGRDAERELVAAGDVVLTSYGTLARDLAWHLRQNYRAVVVDEASLMRNPDTDHAKAVSKLRSAHRIALTGTPLENGVRDLWSVFRFIQPGWLGGRKEFQERYEQSLEGELDSSGVMRRLRLKTSPFLLRRTKEQVAPELPGKWIIDEFCDLSADQQGVYRGLLEEGRKRVEATLDSGNAGAARMQVLTALLRLRQTCCDLALLGNERWNQLSEARRSGKLQRLLELLEEAVNGGHRVLVFSQFQKQLLEIEKCVSERGWASLRLDGQTRKRQQMVDRFQAADGPPIFLISLKAGGYGLNLTAADTVIHFDPWWNPAAEMQATDRAHRIGQTRPVTVYRLLTRGTVEEKVLRLQAKKRELAAVIDEAGGGDAAGWSMQDLAAVMDDV